MKTLVTNSAEETVRVGLDFSKQLKSGDVILLYGDLGAGKTTLVQGVAKGLKVKDRILSPTFVLQRSHAGFLSSTGEGDVQIVLNHIDLYRIEAPTEIENLGIGETVEEENSVTIIEWAERLKNFKLTQGYRIWLGQIDTDKRSVKIEKT